MRKLWIIISETYLRQVKSWSFALMVLAPFILLGISFGIGHISSSTDSNSEINKIAVISTQTNLRKSYIQKNKQDVQTNITNVEKAKKALKNDTIDGYLVLDNANDQISANYHGKKTLDDSTKTQIQTFIKAQQQQLNLEKAQLTPNQISSLQKQPSLKQFVHKNNEINKISQQVSFFIIVFFAYMILIIYSAITASEIASDKGNKVIEVIFSSTSARNYFFGKIIGLLLVISTQVLIYLVGGWLSFLYAKQNISFIANNQSLVNLVLKNLLGFNLLFLVLGTLLYIILSAFSGALVTKVEDASKASQPAIILSMIAFFLSLTLQNSSDTLLVKVLSYVPFFSSYFMPLRIINGTTSILEISCSLIVLIGSIAFMLYYISKIYQDLMLQTNDGNIWKKLRQVGKN